MKNFKIFKLILCLLLIVSLSLSLFGCVLNDVEDDPIESGTDTKGATDTETYVPNHIKYDKVKDYQIIETENGYRLVFDEPLVYEYGSDPGIVGFSINSWEEFSEDLLNGNLSYLQKNNIYFTWPKDDSGFIILNPYTSYKVSHTLPHNISHKGTVSGDSFTIGLTCEDYYKERISITILGQYLYKNVYDEDFGDIDIANKNIEYKKELSDGSVMECYNKTTKTSARFITVKYILSNGTKTIFVVKEYSKESYNDQEQNIPTSISLLGNIDDDRYFYVSNIFSTPQILGHEISEDLTDEFLFGFNVEVVDNPQTAK